MKLVRAIRSLTLCCVREPLFFKVNFLLLCIFVRANIYYLSSSISAKDHSAFQVKQHFYVLLDK